MLGKLKRGELSRNLLDPGLAVTFRNAISFQHFRIIMLCALIASSSGASLGQVADRPLAEYSVRVYTTEQGLPQNEVRSIAQTPDGYLWFGTRDGLARFDGLRFTVFRRETTPGIGHNMFGAMLVDHFGRLWIATGDGLSCYEHGRFLRYTEKEGLPANAVHALLEDRQGRLWAGTWKGLAVFDGTHFRALTPKDGLPSNSISGLAEDGAGGIWVGTYGAGLAHLVGGRFESFEGKDGLPGKFIGSLFHDHEGRLWIGTLTGTLLLGPEGNIQAIHELHGQPVTFYEDQRGTVWVATDKVFAHLNNEQGAVFESQAIANQDAEKHVDVESIFQDRDGSLWIGTDSAGVGRYRTGPFVPYTTDQGLADNNAESIFQDSAGTLWVGTTNGLSRWMGGHFETIATQKLGNGHIRSISEDKLGRLWVATSNGIARFDGHTWAQMGMSEQIPADIHALYGDHEGRMWMGSPEGITLWDRGRISKITQGDGLPGNYVMSIAEDPEGAMWIGTITGLAKLDHGKVTAYTTSNGLLSNYIQCLYEDSEGTLWICTPSGLHRFKNGHLSSFTVKDGLFADSDLSILEDDRHRFWISSYRGIFRVDRNDLNAFAEGKLAHIESVAYGTQDGMKSNTCGGLGMQPAGWRTRSGALWFPTDHGVVSVDPSNLPAPTPPPTPLLEAVLADGAAITSPDIQPGTRRIDFLFAAPTSIQPEAIEYRYRLQGFEDTWHEIGTDRQISFTSLPQGAHLFSISARRRGGAWSVKEATLTIRVMPHFYETWWFFTALALIVLLMIWVMYSLRVRETEQRLNATMAERSRVAQELHDTLLQSVSGTAMEIQGGLRLISLGATKDGMQRLSVALEHLAESMADARQAIWDLRSPESSELKFDQALESAAKRLCAGGSHLIFQTWGKPKALPQCIERQAYRIAVEAVTNAVRHSGCSEVTIRVEYRDKSMYLEVADNGCGFDTTLAESASLSNHWGLAGMQQRAEECNGTLRVQSTLGKGASVVFEAPLRQSV